MSRFCLIPVKMLQFSICIFLDPGSGSGEDISPTGQGVNETDPCDDNPCMNGATCVTLDDEFRCVCLGLFTGLTCNATVMRGNNAQNAQGQGNNAAATDHDSKINTVIILVAVALGVFVVGMLVLIGIFCHAYCKSTRHITVALEPGISYKNTAGNNNNEQIA